MTKKNDSAPTNTLLLAFQGEMVDVLVEVSESVKPISTVGYVVDVDEEFLYLANEFGTNEVAQAIPKKRIIYCVLTPKDDPLGEILDSLPTPTKNEGYN